MLGLQLWAMIRFSIDTQNPSSQALNPTQMLLGSDRTVLLSDFLNPEVRQPSSPESSQGLGFRLQGLGLRLQDLGFRV